MIIVRTMQAYSTYSRYTDRNSTQLELMKMRSNITAFTYLYLKVNYFHFCRQEISHNLYKYRLHLRSSSIFDSREYGLSQQLHFVDVLRHPLTPRGFNQVIHQIGILQTLVFLMHRQCSIFGHVLLNSKICRRLRFHLCRQYMAGLRKFVSRRK